MLTTVFFSTTAILTFVEVSAAAESEILAKAEYCNFHENHTLCIHQNDIAESCGKVVERGLSDAEREEVVRLHNEKRSFIARGLEKRGDPGPQPPAANMMQLVRPKKFI